MEWKSFGVKILDGETKKEGEVKELLIRSALPIIIAIRSRA